MLKLITRQPVSNQIWKMSVPTTSLHSSKSSKAYYSTSEHTDNLVLFDEINDNGLITINRAKALNSINLHMVR